MSDIPTERAHLLPTGVFEMPPERAALMRQAESALLSAFRRWGYQEVRTPAMEYLDTMAQGLEVSELDLAFKMVDRSTGRMMVLRSDVTPQVARMAASALRGLPRPLRLCYVADVYRFPRDASQPRRELIQAGAELIGLADPQGDAELLALAVQALTSLGLEHIRISLGQARYARLLLDRCRLPREAEDRLMAAANRKDAMEMERLLLHYDVDQGLRAPLLGLAELGGGDRQLMRARELAPDRECQSALDNLSEVMELATAYGVDPGTIHVDLGELASFRYHTGVVFSGYVSGAGRAVLRGGRYDRLLERFGNAGPATGFAIDILELVQIVSRTVRREHGAQYLLVNRTGRRQEGLALAVDLRGRGRDVLCLIKEMEDSELLLYARAHRIGSVIILQPDGTLMRLTPETGQAEACRTQDL